jgi:hypothetical protein
MTGVHLPGGRVGELAELQQNLAVGALAARIRRQQAPPLVKEGTVQSIQMSGQQPTYTVLVDGSSWAGARILSHCGGPLTGDTVWLILIGEADWWIIGGPWGDLRSWTPTWVASITNPTLGTAPNGAVQVGRWRMVGPTTMWVNFKVILGSDGTAGSGTYSVNGLPLTTAAYEQVVPVFLFAGSSGNTRYSVQGIVSASTTSVVRLAATGQAPGITNAAPAAIGAGCGMTGTAVLEVVPA